MAAYLSPFELSLSVRLRLNLSGTTLHRLSNKSGIIEVRKCFMVNAAFLATQKNENEPIKGTINVLFQFRV